MCAKPTAPRRVTPVELRSPKPDRPQPEPVDIGRTPFPVAPLPVAPIPGAGDGAQFTTNGDTPMWKFLKNLIRTNWKTTAAGIAVALVWLAEMLARLFGGDLTIPLETKAELTAFIASLGFIFGKDGDKDVAGE